MLVGHIAPEKRRQFFAWMFFREEQQIGKERFDSAGGEMDGLSASFDPKRTQEKKVKRRYIFRRTGVCHFWLPDNKCRRTPSAQIVRQMFGDVNEMRLASSSPLTE